MNFTPLKKKKKKKQRIPFPPCSTDVQGPANEEVVMQVDKEYHGQATEPL